jgi:LPXTG-motif cell wall-anchored protein
VTWTGSQYLSVSGNTAVTGSFDTGQSVPAGEYSVDISVSDSASAGESSRDAVAPDPASYEPAERVYVEVSMAQSGVTPDLPPSVPDPVTDVSTSFTVSLTVVTPGNLIINHVDLNGSDPQSGSAANDLTVTAVCLTLTTPPTTTAAATTTTAAPTTTTAAATTTTTATTVVDTTTATTVAITTTNPTSGATCQDTAAFSCGGDGFPDPPATPPASGGSGAVNGSTSPPPVPAGSSGTVTGSGFAPGSGVTAVFYSDPIVLGTAVADGSGNVSFAVAFPNVTGNHTVVLLGNDPSGNALVLTTPLTLTSSAGSGLPNTGSTQAGMLGIAALLVLAGLAIVVVHPRRETAAADSLQG